MRRNTIIDVICFLLIFLFVYAASSKLMEHASFSMQLSNMDFIRYGAPFLSYALPVSEVSIVFLLLIPSFRLYALHASLILLVLFTVYLSWMVVFKINLPCSCGGVIAKLNWKQHILFNLFFIALSRIGIHLIKQPVKDETNINSLLQ